MDNFSKRLSNCPPCMTSISERTTFKNVLESHTYNLNYSLYNTIPNDSIGDKIKRVRITNRLTQKYFGESIGKALTTIANYESNYRKPSKEILNSIISIYKLDKKYFD